MKDEFFVIDYDGMAGVMASLESRYNIRFFRKEINNFPLPFVSPL